MALSAKNVGIMEIIQLSTAIRIQVERLSFLSLKSCAREGHSFLIVEVTYRSSRQIAGRRHLLPMLSYRSLDLHFHRILRLVFSYHLHLHLLPLNIEYIVLLFGDSKDTVTLSISSVFRVVTLLTYAIFGIISLA